MKHSHRLGIKDFSKMMFSRFAAVKKAPADPVKELNTYAANRIANELFPKSQYLKLKRVSDYSEDYKSLVFIPNVEKQENKLAWFSAGQCISISVDIKGKNYKRPFYISSSPREALNDKVIVLTVKRNENDIISSFLLDELKPGDEVIASAPFGSFTYEPLRDCEDIIAIADDSSVMPFVSMAKAICDGDEKCSLTLLYISKKSESYFIGELEEIADKTEKFNLVQVVDENGGSFINTDLIYKYAQKNRPFSVFICSNPEMIKIVENELLSTGLRKKFIRSDWLGEYSLSGDKLSDSGDIDAVYKLTILTEGREKIIHCSANETLLEAMENAGIKAPNLCRKGSCGWCHSQLISGEVYIPEDADGRRIADKEFDYIHPCCTFAMSDVIIKVPVSY